VNVAQPTRKGPLAREHLDDGPRRMRSGAVKDRLDISDLQGGMTARRPFLSGSTRPEPETARHNRETAIAALAGPVGKKITWSLVAPRSVTVCVQMPSSAIETEGSATGQVRPERE